MQLLAPAHLPHQVRLAHNFVAADILPVTRRLARIDGLAVHLSQQNVRDGAHHRFRRAFQQIRKPYQKPALAQADGVVDVREREKLNLQLRRLRAGTQFPVFLLKNFEQSRTHSEPRLARARLAQARLTRLRLARAKARTLHSGLLPDCFASGFFRCFAASSCSSSSLRWSSTELSSVSSAVVRVNSYCLLSSAETSAASLSARNFAWNSVSASMITFSGLRMSSLRSM